ncbi:MAG TPA: cation:proton antiporter [Myxococcota bacterium]|nr:cation:proton antiporter [Myxococcota bacterium]HRY95884.1 cation:proton antiporter [Myxococcota bacterium]
MNEVGRLGELVVLLGVGVLAALVMARMRLPVIAGLLLAGALAGPHGLALVTSSEAVATVAEVGVILLLFSVGLELSLAKLARIGWTAALGGLLQVAGTSLAVLAVVVTFGGAWERGLAFGFMVALSSTAIVLRGLQDRGEVDAPHGRFIVGTLVLQDLCVVPMMLVIPLLAGGSGPSVAGLAWALGKAVVILAGLVLLARLALPWLLRRVDRTRSREVFFLSVVVVCLGTAYLTHLAGLSLALGAFLAGMLLADGDFSHRALGDILPMRILFTSVFFLSLGMLFNPRVVLEHPLWVAGLFLALLVGKGLLAALAGLAMRFPARVAALSGLALAQFSEFSFVLAKESQAAGLLGAVEAELLLAAGVLTMFVTPLTLRFFPRLAAGAALLRPLERLLGARGITEVSPDHAALHGHVVVVGHGVAGRLLTAALRETGQPYLIIELNADTVRAARMAGEPAYYGDITSPETLAHARVREARVVIVSINDPEAARRAVIESRRNAPDTPVVVRTRYLADTQALHELGATDVVNEELEAGMELMARVLRLLGVGSNELADQLRLARRRHQPAVRKLTIPRRQLIEIPELAALKVDTYRVPPQAWALGRTPAELRLRSVTGAWVVGLGRDGNLVGGSVTDSRLEMGDRVFLVGTGDQLKAAAELLTRGPAQGSVDANLQEEDGGEGEA